MVIAGPTRARLEWAAVAAGLVLLLVAVPHEITGDGRTRFDALAGLLERGIVPDTPYSLVGPLLSAPLYYLGAATFGPEWWTARFNVLLLALGIAVSAPLLRRAADPAVLRAFFLLVVAASMFPNHVRGYSGEMFTAVCVLAGLAALTSARPRLGWTALVLGVVNTPAAFVGLLFVAIRYVRESRRLRYFAPVLAAATLILLESWIRRGHPLVTGYEGNVGFRTFLPYSGRPEFSYPFLFGILSITLSFGKGLLFFAPGLAVPPPRDDPETERGRAFWAYGMWFLAGLILVYAKWWAWYGGWSWGPRFFLAASLPASLAIALTLRRIDTLGTPALGGLLALLTLSAWVGVNGAVFDQANLDICQQDRYALEFLCWYTPEFSVLWRPFVAPAPLSAPQILFASYAAAVYLWLAAPVARLLVARTGHALQAGRAAMRTWRF